MDQAPSGSGWKVSTSIPTFAAADCPSSRVSSSVEYMGMETTTVPPQPSSLILGNDDHMDVTHSSASGKSRVVTLTDEATNMFVPLTPRNGPYNSPCNSPRGSSDSLYQTAEKEQIAKEQQEERLAMRQDYRRRLQESRDTAVFKTKMVETIQSLEMTPEIMQVIQSGRMKQLMHFLANSLAKELQWAGVSEASIMPDRGKVKAEPEQQARPILKAKRRITSSACDSSTSSQVEKKTRFEDGLVKTRDCVCELRDQDRVDIAFFRLTTGMVMQDFIDLLNADSDFALVPPLICVALRVSRADGPKSEPYNKAAFPSWPYVGHPALPGLLIRGKSADECVVIEKHLQELVSSLEMEDQASYKTALKVLKTYGTEPFIYKPAEELIVEWRKAMSAWTREDKQLQTLFERHGKNFFARDQDGRLRTLAKELKKNIAVSSPDPVNKTLRPVRGDNGWCLFIQGFNHEAALVFTNEDEAQTFATTVDTYLNSIIQGDLVTADSCNEMLSSTPKEFVDMSDLGEVLEGL